MGPDTCPMCISDRNLQLDLEQRDEYDNDDDNNKWNIPGQSLSIPRFLNKQNQGVKTEKIFDKILKTPAKSPETPGKITKKTFFPLQKNLEKKSLEKTSQSPKRSLEILKSWKLFAPRTN